MSKPIEQYHINEGFIQEEINKIKVRGGKGRKLVKYNNNNPNLKVITVNIPILDIAYMKLFKEIGLTRSVTEYIRRSIRDRVLREINAVEFQLKTIHDFNENKDVNYEVLE